MKREKIMNVLIKEWQKETEDERIFKECIAREKELGIIGEWHVPTESQLNRLEATLGHKLEQDEEEPIKK
jgi:hypothetical protein